MIDASILRSLARTAEAIEDGTYPRQAGDSDFEALKKVIDETADWHAPQH